MTDALNSSFLFGQLGIKFKPEIYYENWLLRSFPLSLQVVAGLVHDRFFPLPFKFSTNF